MDIFLLRGSRARSQKLFSSKLPLNSVGIPSPPPRYGFQVSISENFFLRPARTLSGKQTDIPPLRTHPRRISIPRDPDPRNRQIIGGGRSIIIWWFLWGPCFVAWRIKGKSTYAPTPFGFQDVNKDVFCCNLERREGIFVSICSGIPGRLLFRPQCGLQPMALPWRKEDEGLKEVFGSNSCCLRSKERLEWGILSALVPPPPRPSCHPLLMSGPARPQWEKEEKRRKMVFRAGLHAHAQPTAVCTFALSERPKPRLWLFSNYCGPIQFSPLRPNLGYSRGTNGQRIGSFVLANECCFPSR